MGCPGQLPEYPEADIQVFTGLEPIRRRPAMYIGSTDARGLHHLLFTLVTESLSEAVAGYGRSVRVALRADGWAEVVDDGRPMLNVEHAFTVLEYGHGRWGAAANPLGRDSFAYTIANALAERLDVTARHRGRVYGTGFRQGAYFVATEWEGPPGDRGLTVKFRPDPDIFGATRFDAGAIRDRLRQLAFLHSGVRITFADETAGTSDAFEDADGIRAYVKHLNESRRPLHADVILLRGEEQGVRYEVGLQWCEEEIEERRSFANHYFTPQGGTHQRGLLSGAAAGLRDFIDEHAPQSGKFEGDDLRAGLTAVVSVWLNDPQFEGATRSRLNSPEAEAVVKATVRRGVCDYFAAHRKTAERVVKAVVAAHEAARAARKKR
jgi:DNA gyrase subunit B